LGCLLCKSRKAMFKWV